MTKENITIIFLSKSKQKCKLQFSNTLEIDSIKEFDINKIHTKYFTFYNNSLNNEQVNYKKIIKYMSKKNIKLFALMPYDKKSKHNILKNINKGRNINITEGYYNIFLESFIIDKELFNNIINQNTEELFIVNLLLISNIYYQSVKEKIYFINDGIQHLTNATQYLNKSWYIDDIKSINCFNNSDLNLQNMLLYLVLIKLESNILPISNNVLNSEDYKCFIKEIKYFVNKIDDKLINYDNLNKNLTIDKNLMYFLIELKNENQNYYIDNGFICSKEKIDFLNNNPIYIDAINYKDGYLYFDCRMIEIIHNLRKINIIVDNNLISYNSNNIFSTKKIFEKVLSKDYTFSFKVDINSKNICIKDEFNNIIPLSFPNVSSRLIDDFKNSYWNFNGKYLTIKKNIIKIDKNKTLSTFINEIKFLFEIINKEKINIKSIKIIFIRFLYFITILLYRKQNIWITYDKIYKTGDCGEYIFRYITDNTDQMIYYILDSKTHSYKELSKKYNHLLSFGSIKLKLLAMHSKVILQTDAKSYKFCSISDYMAKMCKNLLNYDVYCIQHGLTMQDLFHRQNRLFDNTKLYFVASKYEKQNLLQEEYGYTEDQIKITGIPRYDGLKSNPENLLLLFPTWRVDIASAPISGKIREYNPDFKNTNYFKIYNNLINNKKLVELAKSKKYKIIFLIHPTLIANKKDYDENEIVEIISSDEIDFEELLIKSKLMITDYSGIQYDFAYMRKPIIYYHNKKLPPSYGTGKMNYNTMGFGPITTTEEELIDNILEVINANCIIKDEYLQRANKFFEYYDYNNSKRIYEEIKK